MGRKMLAEQFVFRFFKNIKNLDGLRPGKLGKVRNQFFIRLAGRKFPVIFGLIAIKLLPQFCFGEKCVLPVRHANDRRNHLVGVAEAQPPDVIHHLRQHGGAGIPLPQTAREFEFKKDFRRIQVVMKLRVVIQPEMLGVGVLHFLFGLCLKKRLAETGKVFGHLYRAWI